MPFRVPEFNLLCNVWRSAPAIPPVGAPDIADLACQLTWDRTGDTILFWQFGPARFLHLMKLKVPQASDVRGDLADTGSDLVEVPSGTGRFYRVRVVDDVARGFANEFRQCLIEQMGYTAPLP